MAGESRRDTTESQGPQCKRFVLTRYIKSCRLQSSRARPRGLAAAMRGRRFCYRAPPASATLTDA
eukprot:3897443-Pyramimonas_sp.AAC.1